MKNLFKIFQFIFLAALLWSCQDIEEAQNVSSTEDQEILSIDPNLVKYLDAVGFKNKDLSQVEILEDGYLVDGDIFISKNSIVQLMNLLESFPENKQIRMNLLVTSAPNQNTTFYYRISSSIPLAVRNNIKQAFNEWNLIRNFRLKFYETQGSNYNIFVGIDYNTSAFAYAYPPQFSGSNITIGPILNINPDEFYNLSNPKQILIAAHEIGHLTGLDHTDLSPSSTRIRVPGTFLSDDYSIMNSGTRHFQLFGGVPDFIEFPYTDLVAIRDMYPFDLSEKPFYSYASTNSGWGYMTTTWSEIGFGNTNYGLWGITGYIYTTSKTGTVPIYKYTHSTNMPYFSTTSNIHIQYPAYTNNGIVGHVFASSGTGRIPVYEWYNPNVGYFFTTNLNDSKFQAPGWIGGGIAFYTLSLGTQ